MLAVAKSQIVLDALHKRFNFKAWRGCQTRCCITYLIKVERDDRGVNTRPTLCRLYSCTKIEKNLSSTGWQ